MFSRTPRDTPSFLAIGLGNPGQRYANTRHNAGWWVLDELARRHGAGKGYTKHRSLATPVRIEGNSVLLIRPQTFMNVSGDAVAAWLREYRGAPWVLIHDETAFAPGQLRLRRQGSAGGHNGVASVIERTGSQQFDRIRIGVGAPPPGEDLSDYVLHAPPPSDMTQIKLAVDRAVDCVELLLQGEFDKAAQLAVGKPSRNGPANPADQSVPGGKADV